MKERLTIEQILKHPWMTGSKMQQPIDKLNTDVFLFHVFLATQNFDCFCFKLSTLDVRKETPNAFSSQSESFNAVIF